MSRDKLRDSWTSLGIAFNSAASEQVSDPESALIDFLYSQEFPEDRKMVSLILAWLKENSELVHIERLKSLIEPLGSLELAILGGLAQKCVNFGDLRWKTIIRFVKRRNSGPLRFDFDESTYLLSKNGEDQEFLSFGLSLSLVKEDRAEKILTRSQMILKNPWIKNRILFGVNMRADVATVMGLRLAATAYQTSKYLKCSFNAASRNWNDLTAVNFQG